MDTILANDWNERLPEGYDVVVVGSGYGGSITAARLANADVNPRLKVCIVERGQEWPVGQFPDDLAGVLGASYNDPFNPLGLYEFDAFRDIAVIKGSGLGGTSLVNANVAIRPEPDTFADWPSALNQVAQIGEGRPGSLWNYYKLAEQTLDVAPHPSGGTLNKIQALQKRASQLNPPRAVESLRLAVNFDKEGVEVYNNGNGKQIVKHKCIDCGDCVTGCNVGAKNTLYMNYLPLAKLGGAQIFTQTEVDYVERAADGGWLVHVTHRDNSLISTPETLRARIVILAAGALGSPKILLKSQKQGLPTGVGVGTRFGGNGDFFGLAYNSEQITDIIGWGNHPEDPISRVVRAGPSIVGLVRYNEKLPVGQRFVIEDVSIPRAYRDAAALAFRAIPGVDAGVRNAGAVQQRSERDALGADPQGAMNSTMLYLCMARDDSGGSMYLDAFDNLQIDWLGAGSEDILQQINEECRSHAAALGSSFIANPLWNVSPWKTLLTAHPLGGCPMGEDGSDGAVDHLGRVFRGVGTDVHDGLYVADGSILRTALGVNPFLTISALSERIADHIILRAKGVADDKPVSLVAMKSVKDLDPIDVIDYREDQLEKVFGQTSTQSVQRLVNTGQVAIDWENRRIDNDESWKGFFPKGSALNTLSSLLFAGFKKTFTLDGGTVSGVTSDSDGHINARNVLTEIALDTPQGNLEAGQYILLQYPDPCPSSKRTTRKTA